MHYLVQCTNETKTMDRCYRVTILLWCTVAALGDNRGQHPSKRIKINIVTGGKPTRLSNYNEDPNSINVVLPLGFNNRQNDRNNNLLNLKANLNPTNSAGANPASLAANAYLGNLANANANLNANANNLLDVNSNVLSGNRMLDLRANLDNVLGNPLSGSNRFLDLNAGNVLGGPDLGSQLFDARSNLGSFGNNRLLDLQANAGNFLGGSDPYGRTLDLRANLGNVFGGPDGRSGPFGALDVRTNLGQILNNRDRMSALEMEASILHNGYDDGYNRGYKDAQLANVRANVGGPYGGDPEAFQPNLDARLGGSPYYDSYYEDPMLEADANLGQPSNRHHHSNGGRNSQTRFARPMPVMD